MANAAWCGRIDPGAVLADGTNRKGNHGLPVPKGAKKERAANRLSEEELFHSAGRPGQMHCMPLNMCHSSSAENASGLLARGGETYRRNRNGLETARFFALPPRILGLFCLQGL